MHLVAPNGGSRNSEVLVLPEVEVCTLWPQMGGPEIPRYLSYLMTPCMHMTIVGYRFPQIMTRLGTANKSDQHSRAPTWHNISAHASPNILCMHPQHSKPMISAHAYCSRCVAPVLRSCCPADTQRLRFASCISCSWLISTPAVQAQISSQYVFINGPSHASACHHSFQRARPGVLDSCGEL